MEVLCHELSVYEGYSELASFFEKIPPDRDHVEPAWVQRAHPRSSDLKLSYEHFLEFQGILVAMFR
jgi:hypothetical protein